MATPQASEQNHRDFWAGAERAAANVLAIADVAADIRESVSQAPDAENAQATAEYASKSRSAELLVAQLIGEKGVVASAGAGGASVTFADQDQILFLARMSMGRFAVAGDGVAYFGTAPW